MSPKPIDPGDEAVQRVLADFATVAEGCGVRYLLVGGAARILAAGNGFPGLPMMPAMRSTMDLDFGVLFGARDDFERFQGRLSPCFSSARQGEQMHFLHRGTGITVDVIPFGSIAPDGRLPLASCNSDFSVLGFREALDRALLVPVSPGLRVPVADGPGFVMLKLIAFGDRGEPRDLQDVAQVMRQYDSEENRQRYYAELAEEFADEDSEKKLTYDGAKYLLLGVDMGRMALPPTCARLLEVLANLTDRENLALAYVVDRRLVHDRPGTTEDAACEFSLLLQGVQKGFAQSRPGVPLLGTARARS